jgi:uncharacterized protein (AIM24 family)
MTTTTSPSETYTCPYCRQESAAATSSCPACGAPVDVRLRTTSGGWTDLPPIADMTRLQAGQSSVQIEGSICSVADWKLAASEGLFFPHHVVLWQEPSVSLEAMPLSKPWTRHRAGLPMFMMQASGPGQIAFSHDTPGEIIALPLQAGATVDVTEHRLLTATKGVSYDWYESGLYYTTSGRDAADLGAGAGLLKMGLELAGDDRERQKDETRWHYPIGQYIDRFTASDKPGLVLIAAGGNAYTRTLADGESLLVKPPALLFKDPTVNVQLHVEYPRAGMKLWRTWANRYLWLRVTGPGRIGLESCYVAHDDPGTAFHEMSGATQHIWT